MKKRFAWNTLQTYPVKFAMRSRNSFVRVRRTMLAMAVIICENIYLYGPAIVLFYGPAI